MRGAQHHLTLCWGRETSCAFKVSVLLKKYFKAHLGGVQLADGPVPIFLHSEYFVFPHQHGEDGERGGENEYSKSFLNYHESLQHLKYLSCL